MNTQHHAICFIGDNPSGLADKKAQEILCRSNPPCGVCNSCIKAQNKTHPDIIRVRERMPDGKYKVGELREITASAVMRPNDGEFKVYIFTDADTMRPECQNALLKFTEEPPDYVRIIFTAKSADMLLETIKSRLVFINAAGDDAPGAPPELHDIAKDFVTALSARNEYQAVSALSRIKTRDELSAGLDLILQEMRAKNTAPKSSYAEAQKFLLERIDDLKFNPNVALTCTHIAAQMYKMTTPALRGTNTVRPSPSPREGN